MRARSLLTIVSLVAFAAATTASAQEGARQPISKYLESLRAEQAATKALTAEVRLFINSRTRDKAKTDLVGQHLLDRIAGMRGAIVTYKNAKTRFGLQVEFDTMKEILNDLAIAHKGYGTMTGTEPQTITERQRREARAEMDKGLKQALVSVIDQKLGSHGLAEALTAESFEEVKLIAANRVKDRVLNDLDLEMLTWAKFGGPLSSFNDQVMKTGRRLAVKYVGSLLVKLTTNTLIIEFAAGVIVRWVGSVLKRALR